VGLATPMVKREFTVYDPRAQDQTIPHREGAPLLKRGEARVRKTGSRWGGISYEDLRGPVEVGCSETVGRDIVVGL